MIRRLNVPSSSSGQLKLVKELDAFPKLDDSYKETSARSGGVSIVMFVVIGLLVISESYEFNRSEVVYRYGVDTDTSDFLKINVDITVAMPCMLIGADVVDATGKSNIEYSGSLEEIDTVFSLSNTQRIQLEHLRAVSSYVRQSYHSFHDVIWEQGHRIDATAAPERVDDKTPNDACRIKGTLMPRKLAGNFHITLGKPIQMLGGSHIHMSFMMFGNEANNFSHRIHHFSFGDEALGKVNPLDGDETIQQSSSHIYQYFLKAVPTRVDTRFANADTYQFSVTERDRPLDHESGSHGTPGIFFRYELSPIKVYVALQYKPYWKFLTRLCGIVGGVFACTGIINSLIGMLIDLLCCRLQLGEYKKMPPVQESIASHSLITEPVSNVPSYTPQSAALYATNVS